MRKNIFLISSLCLLLTSCNPYNFNNVSYDKGAIWPYEKDTDMVIDGLDNDLNYNNLETFDIYEPEHGVTLKTKTYLGEKGIYLYCETDDKSIFFNKEYDLYANDGIEMHICVDPKSTLAVSNLQKDNQITESMLQIRTDVSGRLQTWVGNYLQGNNYEWTQYYKPVEIAVNIDGKMNKFNASNGYSIEFYVPYIGFGLTKAPEEISIMPAFNNTSSNLDSERKWFTYKGMAHNEPSSWIRVNKDGYQYDGKDAKPLKEISGSRNDEKYLTKSGVEIYEVDSSNANAELRGTFKSFFDESGLYMQYVVFDKTLNRYHDSIWANDGVEFYIDTVHDGLDTIHKNGIYRFGFDIDNGLQSDKCFENFTDTKPYFINKYHKTSIIEINEFTMYGYKYLYTFECFIPFESLNINYTKSLKLYVAFAINSPNENTYILDRKNEYGEMEVDSWLWVDKHYPKNANEYFEINNKGMVF